MKVSKLASKVMDYNRWLSVRALARKPSAIRALQPLVAIPGMISLGGGLPNPETFPFKKLTVTLKTQEELVIEGAKFVQALQYSSTPGAPELVEWATLLQNAVHKPQVSDFGVCFGVGSQDVLSKAFEAVLNPGDTLLIESPTYSGSLAFLRPLGVNFLPLRVDEDGLCPDSLSAALSSAPKHAKPKVLYTIPTGGNPTGTSTTADRRRQIYQLAQEHDLLILEDDPYYFLQFEHPSSEAGLLPSYFSMDVDGRVLRFDSLSKIMSSGMRIGWTTGPKPLIERIVLHSQATTLHPSGVSQAMMLALIEHWGAESVDKFLAHCRRTALFYQQKRDLFLRCAEKHLSGLAKWNTPQAGMFVWIAIGGVNDSRDLIYTRAKQKKVLLVPGFEFFPNETRTNYVRASYSLSNEDQMELALARLAELIRENLSI